MPRPKKPKALKLLEGTYRRDRCNPDAPQPTGAIGKPPAHLDNEEKKAWKELVKMCVPGVLTSADRAHLEVTACLFAQFRKHKGGGVARQLSICLGKLGLSPSDREKVVVPDQPHRKSKWDLS